MQETPVPSLGEEDPLEEEMAAHSSILAWEIPWTGELGGRQSVGLQRVGHEAVTKQQQHTYKILRVTRMALQTLQIAHEKDR